MILKNCTITNGDGIIIKQYVDSTADPLYKSYKGFHDGVDIKAKDVYSFCPGIVVRVGNHYKGYTVTVRCSDDRLIQYCHLKDITVAVNDIIDTGSLIGSVRDAVHVEYLTDTKSKWPVRLVNITYYKTNPLEMLITGPSYFVSYSDNLFNENDFTEEINADMCTGVPEYVMAEFGDNSGGR